MSVLYASKGKADVYKELGIKFSWQQVFLPVLNDKSCDAEQPFVGVGCGHNKVKIHVLGCIEQLLM